MTKIEGLSPASSLTWRRAALYRPGRLSSTLHVSNSFILFIKRESEYLFFSKLFLLVFLQYTVRTPERNQKNGWTKSQEISYDREMRPRGTDLAWIAVISVRLISEIFTLDGPSHSSVSHVKPDDCYRVTRISGSLSSEDERG